MPRYRQVFLNSTSELRSEADRWNDLWRRSDEASPTVRAEMAALGVFSAPVTVIEGEVVLGFDPVKLDQLLDA